jgi:hypothetical protein
VKLLYTSVILGLLSQTGWTQSFETPLPTGPYLPASLTATRRLDWVLNSTFGPTSVSTVSLESAIETWANSPKEYGSHWDSLGKRAASKFGTAAISNTIEASLGSLWGEDPRYHRRGEGSNGSRLGYAIKMAFLAEKTSGGVMPAYARFIAVPASRYISNTWRTPSELTPGGTALRISLGFAKRIGRNIFSEYWPDFRRQWGRHDAAVPSKAGREN